MATSNAAFQRQEARGWMAGLSNLFGKELRDWFGTRTWIVHAILWLAIVNGIVAMILFSEKGGAPVSNAEVAGVGVMVFFVFCYMAMGIGTIIRAQDEIIGERQSGTAAWILSKPASRPAFLLSKLLADAVGILLVMAFLQCLVAFVQLSIFRGSLLSIPGMFAAMLVVFLALLFFLCLTLMLGTLFRNRGAVIGIPIGLLMGYQFILQIVPFIKDFSPYPLLLALGATAPDDQSIASALVSGLPVPSWTPVFATALACVVFVAVAVWRFSREEF